MLRELSRSADKTGSMEGAALRDASDAHAESFSASKKPLKSGWRPQSDPSAAQAASAQQGQACAQADDAPFA